MTTHSSTASVSTDRPGRYGKQLAAHLGRRHGGEWDEGTGTGWVRLADARLALTAREATLDLRVDAPDGATGADLDRLEGVVGRHLVRFATRDVLDVRWRRADGTDGTRQVTESQSDPSAGPAAVDGP